MPIINLPQRTHVYFLHWKKRERFPDETFITTRSISEKYPAYNEEMLDSHFERSRKKLEDDDLIIKKVPITYEPDESVLVPVFPKARFWEFDHEHINWIKGYRPIIQRILERGSKEEWGELVRYYGLPRVSNTVRNQILYMPDYIIDEVCEYFSFKKEELLCYIRKQSMPKHWI